MPSSSKPQQSAAAAAEALDVDHLDVEALGVDAARDVQVDQVQRLVHSGLQDGRRRRARSVGRTQQCAAVAAAAAPGPVLERASPRARTACLPIPTLRATATARTRGQSGQAARSFQATPHRPARPSPSCRTTDGHPPRWTPAQGAGAQADVFFTRFTRVNAQFSILTQAESEPPLSTKGRVQGGREALPPRGAQGESCLLQTAA